MCLWANIVSWVLHVDDYVWHQNRQKGQLLCKRPGISKHAKIHEDMEIQCWTKLHNIVCHLSNKSQPWPKKWLIVSPMKLHGDHLLVWDYIFWGKRKQNFILMPIVLWEFLCQLLFLKIFQNIRNISKLDTVMCVHCTTYTYSIDVDGIPKDIRKKALTAGWIKPK